MGDPQLIRRDTAAPPSRPRQQNFVDSGRRRQRRRLERRFIGHLARRPQLRDRTGLQPIVRVASVGCERRPIASLTPASTDLRPDGENALAKCRCMVLLSESLRIGGVNAATDDLLRSNGGSTSTPIRCTNPESSPPRHRHPTQMGTTSLQRRFGVEYNRRRHMRFVLEDGRVLSSDDVR
jgi:hypothetical protein